MNDTNKSLKKLKYASVGLAVLVMLFGLSAIIGLHENIELLYRYATNSRAIVFNSALSFIMIGAAIILCIYRQYYIVAPLLLLVAVNAVLVLIEHVFDINFGIDRLFFNHYDAYGNAYPGLMAPNTAVCFLLASLAMLFQNCPSNNKPLIFIGSAFSILVLTLGLFFFAVYMGTILDTFLWGIKTPMSKAAAIGFILLGINLSLFSFYNSRLKSVTLIRFMPVILSICIFIITLMLVNEVRKELIDKQRVLLIVNIILIFGTIMAITCGLFLHFLILSLEVRAKLLHSQSILQSTLEATSEGIVVINLNGEVIAHNNSFLTMWGISGADKFTLNRRALTKIIVNKLRNKKEYYLKRRNISANISYQGVDFLELINGNIYERYIMPQIINNTIVGRVASYRDVTAQKMLGAELLHQSMYDKLTNLPNRSLMLDLIRRAIIMADVELNRFALLLIGIDNFSNINNLFGQSNGDDVLKMITFRIQQQINNYCTLGRVAGDKFLILHTNLSSIEAVIDLIRKINVALNAPFEISDNKITITICSGITFYPKDGELVEELLANADLAMLRAKEYGRGAFQFYTSDMNEYTIKHIEMETRLQQALADNKFIVYYQPIVDLNTLKIVAVEALVRLQDNSGALILPNDFIPLAENLGLIKQIGEIVLQQACKQSKAWHDDGLSNIVMAVNISAHQFKYGNIADTIAQEIKNSGIDPAQLELELTESVFLNSSEVIVETLRNITKLGVGLSIDDFGTGFSSFSYVKSFAINKIKIDKSFVCDAVINEQDRIIVSAMIAMGKNLHFTMLAEGIETQEQRLLMAQLGCTQGQGFLFAKPMSADECTYFLKHANL